MSDFKSNPALERLQPLVGEWTMETPQYPDVRGKVSFSWIESGAFLLEYSAVPDSPFPAGIAVIGPDDATAMYSVLYHDSRGVSRVYQMSLSDGVWKQWRQAPGFSQRFSGIFSADGSTITARWEKSSDGSHWEHDFDITYRKVGRE